jgi:hypothetical protein
VSTVTVIVLTDSKRAGGEVVVVGRPVVEWDGRAGTAVDAGQVSCAGVVEGCWRMSIFFLWLSRGLFEVWLFEVELCGYQGGDVDVLVSL